MTSCALRFYQIWCINQFATPITLITLCIIIVTHWAFTTNVAVCKEAVALRTIKLINHFFKSFFVLIDIFKNVLSNLCVNRSRCSSKSIEITIEPVINLFVYYKVFIADLTRCLSFLLSFGLSCCTVFICSANIYRIMSRQSTKPCIDISRKYTSNDVTKMWHVIYIWKSTCNQNISLSWLRSDLTSVCTDQFCV